MRYKITYFYLPLYYDMIGSRIHHFELDGESSVITEHPGNSYSDDSRDYFLIEGSKDIYRSYIPGGEYSNWFIRIVAESDPVFNFDIAYLMGDEDEIFNRDRETYGSSLVPLLLEDKILRMSHAASNIRD